jgi:hypothetical protein
MVTYVRDDSSGRSIVVRELKTGRERELYAPSTSIQLGRTVVVSANGRHIAFTTTNLETRTSSVMVLTVTGENPRALGLPIALPDSWDDLSAVTPDGRFVLYTTWNQDAQATRVWRVPVGGGAPQEIRFPLRGRRDFDSVSLHPDGKQIAFVAETPTPRTQTVWALENFLPRTSSARP